MNELSGATLARETIVPRVQRGVLPCDAVSVGVGCRRVCSCYTVAARVYSPLETL